MDMMIMKLLSPGSRCRFVIRETMALNIPHPIRTGRVGAKMPEMVSITEPMPFPFVFSSEAPPSVICTCAENFIKNSVDLGSDDDLSRPLFIWAVRTPEVSSERRCLPCCCLSD